MFKAIKEMIGSLLPNKRGDWPVFHTGGFVSAHPELGTPYLPGEFPAILASRRGPWPCPGHTIYVSTPRFGGRMSDDLAQRQRAKPFFHINVTQPKTRKRPITGDMAQMCQDLGIEPSMSYEDFSKHLQKVIADSFRLPPRLVIDNRRNGWM